VKLAAYSTARQLLASYFCRTFLCAGLIGPGESEEASFPNPDEDALANRQQPGWAEAENLIINLGE
jgi:hypothetical protein